MLHSAAVFIPGDDFRRSFLHLPNPVQQQPAK
jgi:hypothetical protein